MPDRGYAFITTPNGRETNFHRNRVQAPGFERPSVGAEVVFSEEQGHEGPGASTLTAVS